MRLSEQVDTGRTEMRRVPKQDGRVHKKTLRVRASDDVRSFSLPASAFAPLWVSRSISSMGEGGKQFL